MADEPLAPMTDWRDRVWAKYDLVVPNHWTAYEPVVSPYDRTPCFKVPCPSFSPGPDDVQLPALTDLLKMSATEYRQRMRSPVDTSVTVYLPLPQWVVDKLTDRERQLLSDWKMTVRTRYP